VQRNCKGYLKKSLGLIISDEDFALIAIGKEMKRKCVLITDIIEARFTDGTASFIEKKMNKEMQKMIQACDCIIIPEIGNDKDNIRYVRPIVRQVSADRSTLRKRFDFNKKIILVTVGGTDAAKYLLEKAMVAHRNLKSDSELVIIAGPSLNLPIPLEYRNLGFMSNLHELIYSADLVISLAGRSTMDKSIVYDTPGIFIPIKNHFEHSAARLGYKYDDIFRPESLIEEKLSKRNKTLGASGAQRAAKNF
jgi:UDP-N-acetylglucosamine--N-acetylmuramyl-(pentapeptide) pyrophosphoryl-undecaprenol N-acetylglucosamine transferase